MSPAKEEPMASKLYKDGVVQFFEADRVQTQLANGWRVSNKPLNKMSDAFKKADLNKSGKLSPTEIRVAARDAGIKEWETARIGTLKKELNIE